MEKVFLVGARASGKTTVGKLLAERRGAKFIDTDHLLCESCGMTVEEVVKREGWEGFRARERRALIEAAIMADVVATGGGVVLDPENRLFMRESGVVVFLSVPAALLAERLERDSLAAQRPSLTGKPAAEEMAAVLAEREPVYRRTAHCVVDAAGETNAVVGAIVDFLERTVTE